MPRFAIFYIDPWIENANHLGNKMNGSNMSEDLDPHATAKTLVSGTVEWIRKFFVWKSNCRLVVHYGNGRKRKIAPNTLVSFGRGPESDVCICNDALMSRLHFSIQHCVDHLVLTDLSSTNGTWLNGFRIESSCVAPQDRIVAGSTKFVLSMQDGDNTQFDAGDGLVAGTNG